MTGGSPASGGTTRAPGGTPASRLRAAGLTPRQAEVLRFCVAQGYYQIPRRTTLRTLGAKLGVSSTALSLALRRAEAKVMSAHAEMLGAMEGRLGADPPSPRRN